MQTITRKFLVKKIPNLQGIPCVEERRFYLYHKNGTVIRVQSKDKTFELERKITTSHLARESEKIILTNAEFNALSSVSNDFVIRGNYKISTTPGIVLRIYHERFEGLVRAEVSFQSVKLAKSFVAFEWMGKEITNTPLGTDEALIDLSMEDFVKELKIENNYQ
jgi:CYTH domain-containing protein